MIRMKDVSFRYLNSTEGVSGIDLMVNEGECVVFTVTIRRRKNHSHTTFKCPRSFLLHRNTDWDDIYKWKIIDTNAAIYSGKADRQCISRSKEPVFLFGTAGEAAFACENYGFSAEEIRDRTDDAIVSFGLNGFRSRNLDVLSSGEKQKVAIASVYALRPDIYVCDEPTSNLDKTGAEQLAAVFKQLKAEGAYHYYC